MFIAFSDVFMVEQSFPLTQIKQNVVISDKPVFMSNETNYQGCQFDVHFIQYQTFTDILGIVNEFAQYVQNYFQYLYIPI